MVWFQCEVCGENLKKPKLANHFRICSARKLSCIDCGDTFSRESVQSHTQCMTEAEKYGPKDQGKLSQNLSSKPEKPKKNADVDINVGLTSRPPWFCSLCNSPATSQQTLLSHADGKKHRAKAKAFLASQEQSNQTEETKDDDEANGVTRPSLEALKSTVSIGDESKESFPPEVVAQQILEKQLDKKRKHDDSGVKSSDVASNGSKDLCDLYNGEVIQAGEKEKSRSKKHKIEEEILNSECAGNKVDNGEAFKKKIKWKKLVVSILKSKPDGAMKIKKLNKLIIEELMPSGINGEEEVQLCDAMMKKIHSSSRFIINNKFVSLAPKKTEKS